MHRSLCTCGWTGVILTTHSNAALQAPACSCNPAYMSCCPTLEGKHLLAVYLKAVKAAQTHVLASCILFVSSLS